MNEKTASAVLVRAGLANDARRRARSNRHSGGFIPVSEARDYATGVARGSIWYYMIARRIT